MQSANKLKTARKEKQLNVIEGRKSTANRPDRRFLTEQVHFFLTIKTFNGKDYDLISNPMLWIEICINETCDVMYTHSRRPTLRGDGRLPNKAWSLTFNEEE